jgi:hypothetical protein
MLDLRLLQRFAGSISHAPSPHASASSLLQSPIRVVHHPACICCQSSLWSGGLTTSVGSGFVSPFRDAGLTPPPALCGQLYVDTRRFHTRPLPMPPLHRFSRVQSVSYIIPHASVVTLLAGPAGDERTRYLSDGRKWLYKRERVSVMIANRQEGFI